MHLNEEQLLELLDGNAFAQQQSHLKTCLKCQQLRDEILQVRAELRQLPVAELPASLQSKTWQLWEQHKSAQQQLDEIETHNASIRTGVKGADSQKCLWTQKLSQWSVHWPVLLRYGGAVSAGFILAILLLQNHWSATNSIRDANMDMLVLTQKLEQQLVVVADDSSRIQPIIQRYLQEINIIDSQISEVKLSSHERRELWQERSEQLKTVIELYEHNSFIGEI